MGLLEPGAPGHWLCYGSIWPPASRLARGPLPLLPLRLVQLRSRGLCLHFPWQGNRDSAWKEFSCLRLVSPPCSLTLPQLAMSHRQRLVEVKELGNLLLPLLHQPSSSSSCRLLEQRGGGSR